MLFSTVVYRLGFNGQEKYDEVSGTANSVIAKFWEYDNSISFPESLPFKSIK